MAGPSLVCLTGFALLFCTFCDGKVMMEYIGALGIPISFDDVPIDPEIDFNFILSFAIDADRSGKYQNGKFSPYWSEDITPSSVKSFKARHPNVKVLASLAGWSLGEKVIAWYKPRSNQAWINNAFASFKRIAVEYGLDGIDIDYENFPRDRNDTTFAFCIGELITRLKEEKVITVASIAPYYLTVGPYVMLYRNYSGVIDYVNHQFYTDKVRSPAGYLLAFRQRAAQFDAAKLLPSYEIRGRGIQGDSFFDALGLLRSRGFDVEGVMIWSADSSKEDGFYFERKSQQFLLNATVPSEEVGMQNVVRT
ncbi:chitinase 2-like isoform X1 [Iris pallida]|uniref:Chitinase 2-like isoform X1 n=1 Tax=Iris pallida TaxID=29817 RepID=A0AAX6EHG5_IRIPA|nr:chitinase 2-like isoform X1 [Iris pallida]